MRAVVPLLICALAATPAFAASTATGLGPIPAVPAGPPAPAVIPPPDMAPPHPTAPPAPPVVHQDAPGDSSTIDSGLRLTFGPDRADLNPATAAALAAMAQAGKDRADVTYTISAHAPGTAEDASTPRRLSLERALAVRSALIHAGIASTRIYVHALGAAAPTAAAPDDRVDVTFGTIGQASPAARPQGSTAAP